MPLFEVRKNTEFVMQIRAMDEADAITTAEHTNDDEWDQSYSPITAEVVEEPE